MNLFSFLFPKKELLLHNDDTNDGNQIIRAVQEVFGFEHEKSRDLVMKAHNSGVSTLFKGSKKECEKHKKAIFDKGLELNLEIK